jgi:dihydropteroate synthase
MNSIVPGNVFSMNLTLNVNGELIDLRCPQIMGILNVTPDSFYDGGRYVEPAKIVGQAEKMLSEGADFLDIGGYSSRPGAYDITEDEEMERVVTAVRLVKREFPQARLSIDTFRSNVARAAVGEGADIINDISGGELDKNMFTTVAALRVPYILMHMRGTPQTMNQKTDYENLLKDMTDYFHRKIEQLRELHVKDIIVDPGFGFAKTVEQNFYLLRNMNYFSILGRPLLAGLSRKSLIWRTLNITPEEALNGSTVLNTLALLQGASILRVHDVKSAKETIKLVTEARM